MNNIYKKINTAFVKISVRENYKHLQSIGGTLSTTFSHPVFAMPHMKKDLKICGFNTALRPTDNDEGTHLVAFSQYYFCTNISIADQINYIRQILTEVVQKTFPSELQIKNFELQ